MDKETNNERVESDKASWPDLRGYKEISICRRLKTLFAPSRKLEMSTLAQHYDISPGHINLVHGFEGKRIMVVKSVGKDSDGLMTTMSVEAGLFMQIKWCFQELARKNKLTQKKMEQTP